VVFIFDIINIIDIPGVELLSDISQGEIEIMSINPKWCDL